MIVLIINGAPRAGKDTFIELVAEVIGEPVAVYSSIDWVKEQAKIMGWDGVKDTKGRAFCSEIKDACTKYNDRPFTEIMKMYEKAIIPPYNRMPYFCTNIREPAEITKLEDHCAERSISCYSIWIRNHTAEKNAETLTNSGDTQYMNHSYSFQVPNHTTLDDFKNGVEILLSIITQREVNVHNNSGSNQIEKE